MRRAGAALLTALVFLFPLSNESRASGAARELTVAVSANAFRPVREIAAAFETSANVKVSLVSGSTGKLYTQIVQGAPFHVFLAADSERPALLEEKGLGIKGTRFTYARGVLALWTPRSDLFGDLSSEGASLDLLASARVERVAIANPKTAPYGAATFAALERRGLLEKIQHKFVYGESVTQALSIANSGNADVAIVALSTIYGLAGDHRLVDEALYEPIIQQGVAIKDSPAAALEFMEFLRSDAARAIFGKYGYLTE